MTTTGSVVMLAEAFEGLSDLVASGLLLIGLRISKRRPNKKHPFGFGKALFFTEAARKKKLTRIFRIFLTTTHVETKNTFILDLTGTASALMGLISLALYQLANIQYFDAIGAILIGMLIAVSSVMLIWGVKDYLTGKTASAETEESIRKATHQLKEVVEIIGLETMYIGSEKLLVHLDINVRLADQEDLEQTVEKIKDLVQKEVPVVYSIQVETRSLSSP